MARETLLEIGHVVDQAVKRGVPPGPTTLAELAARVSKTFGVHEDEVAILTLTGQGHFLKFLVPEKLEQLGNIPMTSTSSLAVRTAREKRAELVNNFVASRHVSFFESVQLRERPADPIQKLMSAPVTVDGSVVGVIQISRKGSSPASAGPDFNPSDLKELMSIARALGPCLKLCAQA